MTRSGTWLLAAIALLGSATAQAATITYIPSGTFSPGTGATAVGPAEVTFTSGSGATLTTLDILYTPQPLTSVNSGTTPILGTFTVTVTGPGSVSIPTSPTPTTFTQSIAQSTPTVGTGSFLPPAMLFGSDTAGGGLLGITFTNPTLTIGPVTYQLLNLTQNVGGIPNNTLLLNSSGTTTLTALVTSSVPEPGSLMLSLAGGGVLGLLGLRRGRDRDRDRAGR